MGGMLKPSSRVVGSTGPSPRLALLHVAVLEADLAVLVNIPSLFTSR